MDGKLKRRIPCTESAKVIWLAGMLQMQGQREKNTCDFAKNDGGFGKGSVRCNNPRQCGFQEGMACLKEGIIVKVPLPDDEKKPEGKNGKPSAKQTGAIAQLVEAPCDTRGHDGC
jgi:hypothetical protein